MLIARELPPEEWPRLDATELGAVRELMDPKVFTVVVVETETGEIVGTWAFLSVLHADGLWIAPTKRRSVIGRMLIRSGCEVMQRVGVKSFIAGVLTEEMRGYLSRLGGSPLPPMFAVPVAGPRSVVRVKET